MNKLKRFLFFYIGIFLLISNANAQTGACVADYDQSCINSCNRIGVYMTSAGGDNSGNCCATGGDYNGTVANYSFRWAQSCTCAWWASNFDYMRYYDAHCRWINSRGEVFIYSLPPPRRDIGKVSNESDGLMRIKDNALSICNSNVHAQAVKQRCLQSCLKAYSWNLTNILNGLNYDQSVQATTTLMNNKLGGLKVAEISINAISKDQAVPLLMKKVGTESMLKLYDVNKIYE